MCILWSQLGDSFLDSLCECVLAHLWVWILLAAELIVMIPDLIDTSDLVFASFIGCHSVSILHVLLKHNKSRWCTYIMCTSSGLLCLLQLKISALEFIKGLWSSLVWYIETRSSTIPKLNTNLHGASLTNRILSCIITLFSNNIMVPDQPELTISWFCLELPLYFLILQIMCNTI